MLTAEDAAWVEESVRRAYDTSPPRMNYSGWAAQFEAAIARGAAKTAARLAEVVARVDKYDAEATRARNALTRFGVADTEGEVPHHRALSIEQRINLLGDDRGRLAARLAEVERERDAAMKARDWFRFQYDDVRVRAYRSHSEFREMQEGRDALRAEVEAYKRAKAENDERFMIERDEARAEVERLRGQFEDERTGTGKPDLALLVAFVGAEIANAADAEADRVSDAHLLTRAREIVALTRGAS